MNSSPASSKRSSSSSSSRSSSGRQRRSRRRRSTMNSSPASSKPSSSSSDRQRRSRKRQSTMYSSPASSKRSSGRQRRSRKRRSTMNSSPASSERSSSSTRSPPFRRAGVVDASELTSSGRGRSRYSVVALLPGGSPTACLSLPMRLKRCVPQWRRKPMRNADEAEASTTVAPHSSGSGSSSCGLLASPRRGMEVVAVSLLSPTGPLHG